MKLALLTGATGFLGKHIQKSLSNNFNVFTLSRFKGNYIVSLETEEPIFIEKFEIVIHAAGKAHSIPATEYEKVEFHKVNVGGTKNLLNGLAKLGPPKYFVFISSVAVYGCDNGLEIDEKHPLLALDPYGLSKIEAEKLVMIWCIKHKVKCTILRLPLLVGDNPPGNLKAMINGINKGYYFNISGGQARKSMVLVTDVAKFILKASEVGGTYNLTDGYHPSLKDLSVCLAKRIGKNNVPNMPLFFAKVFAILGDFLGSKFPINSNKLNKITSNLTFDDSKARLEFGWNPTPVLKGCKINE